MPPGSWWQSVQSVFRLDGLCFDHKVDFVVQTSSDNNQLWRNLSMISQIDWKTGIWLMLAFSALCSQTVIAEDTWPRNLDFDLGVMQLYEPEIVTFEGNSVEALAAVAIKMGSPGTPPVFAAIRFSAISESAPTASTLSIHDIELTGLHFGEGVEQNPNELIAALEQALGKLTLTIEPSHRIARTGAADQFNAQGIKSDPINILFRTVASVLVALDGEPKLQPIENSDLAWVANSTFPMLYQRGSYYLLIDSKSAFSSTNLQGPWTQVSQLPANIRQLFNQTDPDIFAPDGSNVENPDIIVTTEPTELLVSEGIPAWAPIAGMQLLYMTNTDNDIFLDLQSGRHYVLLQGRWYAGLLDKTGSTWLPVGNDELPAPFADIDVLSPKSHVLAFVDGTPQARAALLENKLPQGKAVSRNDTSFEAEWDGEPQFETVEQNDGLEYALNTPDSVFRVGDRYYACEDSVWYESTSAFGPWWIATEVPDIIYAIPPSNPQHRVTYARIYDVTPDFVYVGYTPGYLHHYNYRGSVVFGSGWRYQPWYGSHYYSHLYSQTWGWGFQSYYDPWLAWGYVNPVFRPHYYSYNRHRNTWYYNQKRHHRRTARHHNDYRNDNWQNNDDHNSKGRKSGRHRVVENRSDHQAVVNGRDSSGRSSFSNRNSTRNSARNNRTRSDVQVAQHRVRPGETANRARSNRARSDVSVAQHRPEPIDSTNRARRSGYQTTSSQQLHTSRPDRVRSERLRPASSNRRAHASDAAVTNTYANSGQHRGRPSAAARVPDQAYRSTANRSRPAVNPTVAASAYSANDNARKPAANVEPQRQQTARPSSRSHDRSSASRRSEPGKRRHR